MKYNFRRAVRWFPTGSSRGVLALVTGSAAGQGLAFLSAPLIARLYAPESFGIFAYLFSVCAVLTAVAGLRLEAAIPLEHDINGARALTRASLYSAVLFSLATIFAVVVFEAQLSTIAGFEILPWAWWLPVLVVLTSWFNTLSQAAIRQRAYSVIAVRTFVQNAGVVAGQIAFSSITRTAGGLLSGQLVGRSLGILALARSSRDLLPKPIKHTTVPTLRRYWRFPVVFAPSALLNTVGTNLPLILIGAWFGTEAAGLLGLTQRVAMAPAALIAVAVGQVFSGEISSKLRAGHMNNRSLYIRTSAKLAVLGAALTVVLLAASSWAFPLLFGSQWKDSGDYAQAIAISVGAGFVVSPVSIVYIAYQRVSSNILVDISRVALVAGLGVLAFLNGFSAVATIWVMSVGQVANYLLTWVIGLVIVGGINESDSG